MPRTLKQEDDDGTGEQTTLSQMRPNLYHKDRNHGELDIHTGQSPRGE